VEAGDRLLADVTALGEADGVLDDGGLGGHRGGVHLGTEAGDTGLDPDDLDRRGTDLDRAGIGEGDEQAVAIVGGTEEVDPVAGADR
jgi:hypothetical protein